jgi:hypothetical protein
VTCGRGPRKTIIQRDCVRHQRMLATTTRTRPAETGRLGPWHRWPRSSVCHRRRFPARSPAVSYPRSNEGPAGSSPRRGPAVGDRVRGAAAREAESAPATAPKAAGRRCPHFSAGERAGEGTMSVEKVKRSSGEVVWRVRWRQYGRNRARTFSTWAAEGRATFEYADEVHGEPHIVWRRIGTHDIFRRP